MKNTVKHHRRHFPVWKIILMACGGIIAAIFFAALFAIIVRALWNWLMPAIFGLTTTISYLQAFGLVILTRLLVGGWHTSVKKYRDGGHYRRCYWKKDSNSSEGSENVEKACHEHWEFHSFWDFWEHYGKKAFKKYMEEKSGTESSENK